MYTAWRGAFGRSISGCGCGDDLHGDFLPEGGGLKEFQLSIGHADFFRGLMEAAGLLEEQEGGTARTHFQQELFGVEEFVETLNLEENLKNLFGMLGNLYTGSDELSAAKGMCSILSQDLKGDQGSGGTS